MDFKNMMIIAYMVLMMAGGLAYVKLDRKIEKTREWEQATRSITNNKINDQQERTEMMGWRLNSLENCIDHLQEKEPCSN